MPITMYHHHTSYRIDICLVFIMDPGQQQNLRHVKLAALASLCTTPTPNRDVSNQRQPTPTNANQLYSHINIS